MDSVVSWVILTGVVIGLGFLFVIKAITEYERIKREERDYWAKREETWD